MGDVRQKIQELETELARLRKELDGLPGSRAIDDPGCQLQALMKETPDHIYFKDLASRFVRANRAMAKSFGVADPEDLVGKTDFDVFTENHARQAYEDEQEILRTGLPKADIEEAET